MYLKDFPTVFSSETLAASSTIDDLQAAALTLHELHHGPKLVEETKELVENGSLDVWSILVTDSMSLYAALAVAVTRTPAEKSLAVHIFWLKQQLTIGKLTALAWADTRGMTVDPHTKGKVERHLLLELQKGIWQPQHTLKVFAPTLDEKPEQYCIIRYVVKPKVTPTGCNGVIECWRIPAQTPC